MALSPAVSSLIRPSVTPFHWVWTTKSTRWAPKGLSGSTCSIPTTLPSKTCTACSSACGGGGGGRQLQARATWPEGRSRPAARPSAKARPSQAGQRPLAGDTCGVGVIVMRHLLGGQVEPGRRAGPSRG